MTKLVIFDLDGTLLNTVEDLGNATNYALKTLGYPQREIEEYKILCGRGIANLLKDALPEDARTDDTRARMANLFFPYYREHINDCTVPYDGIIPMLDRLAAEGIRFALASNKYQEGAERLIGRFFGKYGFATILGQREGYPIKPDTAIVDQILADNPDISRDEVVYVGDSNVDMMTGNNARVRTIGVTWGFRSREELAAHNPWKLIDTPADLAEAILGSFADRVERIVRRASSIMREKNFEIHTKGGDVANLCTSADIGVQHFLYDGLSALIPGSGFLGEEEEVWKVENDRRRVESGKCETAVELRHVNFCYNDEVPVLHDINISVPQGTTLALVGASGSGKSTIADLICRFYECHDGDILLDGQPVSDMPLADLRSRIGVVAQDTLLFNDTVAANIAFGRPGATPEDIEQAARAAQAHDFISAMPEGYNTCIGEGGGMLSGGQRQRISIARALLREPELLILDEATSALDTESEHMLQATLGEVLQGRTAIVIAHRLSTVAGADNIVVLDHGRIVEQGRHDELMALGGRYKQMVQLQSLD